MRSLLLLKKLIALLNESIDFKQLFKLKLIIPFKKKISDDLGYFNINSLENSKPFEYLVIGKGISLDNDAGVGVCISTITGPKISSDDFCELNGIPGTPDPVESTPFESIKIGDGLKLTRIGISQRCDYLLSGPEIGTYHDSCDPPSSIGDAGGFGRLFFGGGLQLHHLADDPRYKPCDYAITGPKVKGDGWCGSSPLDAKYFSTLTFGKGLRVNPSNSTSQNDACKAYTINSWTLTAGVNNVTKISPASCGGTNAGVSSDY